MKKLTPMLVGIRPLALLLLTLALLPTLTAQTFYQSYPQATGLVGTAAAACGTGFRVTGLAVDADRIQWNLIDLDEEGRLLQQNPLSLPTLGNADTPLRLSDGSYFQGAVPSLGGNDQVARFRHVDAAGTLLDEFTIPFPDNSGPYVKPALLELASGRLLLVTGYAEGPVNAPPNTQRLLYTEYDPTTDQIIRTQDQLFTPGDFGARINGITEASDGKILLNLWLPNVPNRHYLLKTERDGSVLWQTQVSSLERPVTAIVPTDDGGVWYLVPAFNIVSRLDANGDLAASFDIGAFQNGIMGPAEILGLVAAPNSACLVLGTARPGGQASTLFSALVAADGSTQESHLLDVPEPLPSRLVGRALGSDGFLVTGRTGDVFFDPTIPYLLRLDAAGNYQPPPSDFIDLSLRATGSVPNPAIYTLHDVSITIDNTGNLDATGIVVRLPLPAGVVPQGGNELTLTQGSFDPASRLWSIGTLPAGGEATIQLNYFKLTEGSFTQYGEVVGANEPDPDSRPANGQAPEEVEDDEVAFGNRGIDFDRLALFPAIDAVAQGAPLELDYRFVTTYFGTPYPTRVVTGFFLSPDTNLSSDDTFIGAEAVDVDQSGQSNRERDLIVSTNTETGFFYLIAKVDDRDRIAERDEDNNVGLVTRRILVTDDFQGQPDLVAGFFNVTASNPYQVGDRLLGTTYQLFNTGTPASGDIQLAYYLSEDQQLDATDILLASDPFPPVEILDQTPQFISPNLIVPPGTPTGTYYVLLAVDDEREVAESYEDNNFRVSANPILINGSDPCSPDVEPPLIDCPAAIALTTTGPAVVATWPLPTVSDNCSSAPILTSNFVPGEAFPPGSTTVTYTVRDAAGNAATCSFDVTVTLINSSTCDDNLLRNPGFEAGFAGWLNRGGGTLSSNAAAGNRAVRVDVEGENRVIQAVPDQAGQAYRQRFRGDNTLGPGESAGLVFVKFLTANWQPLPLDPGRAVPADWTEATIAYQAPANAAFAEVNLTADPTASVFIDEVCLRAIGSGDPQPDLRLENLSAPTTAVGGSTINYRFDLNNAGLGAVPGAFAIRAYFSTDAEWSPDDIFDGLIATGNLGAGQGVNDVPGASVVPPSLATGDYFLILWVDADERVFESDESNNFIARPIRISASQAGEVNCSASSDFPWEDWIARVRIGPELDQASGKRPYRDFDDSPFDLPIGSTVDIALTAAYSYFTYDENWQIWIDLNGDEIFQSDELVYTGLLRRPADGTPQASLTDRFVLPAGASPGAVRLRVIMSREVPTGPCGTIAFGEVEDYRINLTADRPNLRRSVSLAGGLTIRPQPIVDRMQVKVSEQLARMERLVLVNSLGQVLWMRDLEKEALQRGEWSELELGPQRNGVYFLWAYGAGRPPISERVLLQDLY